MNHFTRHIVSKVWYRFTVVFTDATLFSSKCASICLACVCVLKCACMCERAFVWMCVLAQSVQEMTLRWGIQHWLHNSQQTPLFFPFLLLIRQDNIFGWWHALYIRNGWSLLCLNKISPSQRRRGLNQYWNCPATSTRLITASDLPAPQVSASAYL